MKSKKTNKNLNDFNAEKVTEEQIQSIKGGQGSLIVIEDAEGI